MTGLSARQAGPHDHVSPLPVGDPVGLAEPVCVGDLEVEPGSCDEFSDLISVGGQAPFDYRCCHFGEGFAFGLVDVEHVNASKPHRSALVLVDRLQLRCGG